MYERSTRAIAERLGWPDGTVEEAFAFEERHPGYRAWWAEGWCVYIGEGSRMQGFPAATLDELEPVITADETARREAHEAHMAEIRRMYKNYR